MRETIRWVTIAARPNIEAQNALNDIFPGDPYEIREEDLQPGMKVLSRRTEIAPPPGRRPEDDVAETYAAMIRHVRQERRR